MTFKGLPMKRLISATAFILMGSISLVHAYAASSETSAPVTQDASGSQDEAAVVKRVMAAITKNHLTKVDQNCLALSFVEGDPTGAMNIDVREHHGDGCPGDPETEPHLFQVRVDKKTNHILTDANSVSGKFKRLKE
jgi:hypothetical protein